MAENHTHLHQSVSEELDHLVTDSKVLGAVGAAAVVSDTVGIPVAKTALSLGGEDVWWVFMNARDAWRRNEGNRLNRLREALSASKISLGVLVGVTLSSPLIEHSMEAQDDFTAAGIFSTASVAISSSSLAERYMSDRKNGYKPSEIELVGRRNRVLGIGFTFVLALALRKHIQDGNPYALAVTGGVDCLATSALNLWYVKYEKPYADQRKASEEHK